MTPRHLHKTLHLICKSPSHPSNPPRILRTSRYRVHLGSQIPLLAGLVRPFFDADGREARVGCYGCFAGCLAFGVPASVGGTFAVLFSLLLHELLAGAGAARGLGRHFCDLCKDVEFREEIGVVGEFGGWMFLAEGVVV